MAKGKPLDVDGLDWFYENTPSNRRPRGEDRKEADARDHLTDRVLALTPDRWESAPFPEEILEALREYHRIPEGARGAITRQRNRLSALWAQDDVPHYEDVVDTLVDQPAPTPERRVRAVALRDALLTGGPDALTDAFATHPGLDRQRTRQLVQNARKSPETPTGRRAAAQLLAALQEALGEGPADPDV